jgi:hypothetical protein
VVVMLVLPLVLVVMLVLPLVSVVMILFYKTKEGACEKREWKLWSGVRGAG